MARMLRVLTLASTLCKLEKLGRAALVRLLGCAIGAALLCAQALGSQKPRIRNAPANGLAQQVLNDLLSTPLGKTMPRLPWDFFLIDDWQVSASSDGSGRIFVTTGMVNWYLGKAKGLWAAVLAHEIGHALILNPAYWPGFEAALRSAQRKAGLHDGKVSPTGSDALSTGRGSAGNHERLPFAFGSAVVFDVGKPKEREYAADYIALVLMAEAGYHPDYALTLDRWMSGSIFDPPRLAGFLESHPRWRDREERAQKNYPVALGIFESRWPDVAKSPGGIAPPRGKLGAITVNQSPDGRELRIDVPVSVSKAQGAQLRVAAIFMTGRYYVESARAEFRSPDGTLELNREFSGSVSVSRDVAFRFPVSAMATAQSKLRLVVFLMAADLVLDVAYIPVEVRFPGT